MHELYRKKNRVKGVRKRERERERERVFKVLPLSRKQQKLCTEKLEAEKNKKYKRASGRKEISCKKVV